MSSENKITRRKWLAALLMGVGIVLSYGMLLIEGVLFLLPSRTKPKRRKLFAGNINQYKVGAVQTFYNLQGEEILVRRNHSGFDAFSSTCPHLGCKVKWVPEDNHFFCPCHRGVFDENGKAIAGPPAEGNQDMKAVPIDVDEKSGVVFIEVKDIKGRLT